MKNMEYNLKDCKSETSLKCPLCGHLINVKVEFDGIEGVGFVLCGKCLHEFTVLARIIIIKDYNKK